MARSRSHRWEEVKMLVIELDLLLGFVNSRDPLHQVACEFFERVARGELEEVKVAASAFLEYEFVLSSRGLNAGRDILSFKAIPNLGEAPITAEVLVKASELRKAYGLTYFDSLHAATALLLDKKLVSTDREFRRVRELEVVDPRSL